MDLEREAAQRVGTTLCNKWTLERLIGTGGMAAVYVANHKIGRREAIKILHADVARDPELRERFEQEARAVNRFKHPGAVDVRDIDVTEDGSPFMVMELLEGHPLSDLARQPGGVEIGALLRITDELLDVLAAAHAQSIIHRDIKPDNLFVLQDGRLKVLDFGIARVRGSVQTKLRTRAGATLGTAPYMPPEQIRGLEIDARADIFAVGATLFRLIARRRIHEAVSEADTLVKMASAQAPSLASVAPDTPREVCLVVDRALMFDREQRYPDALTMQSDVRAIREGRSPLHVTSHPALPAPPNPPSQRATAGSLEAPHPPSAAYPPPALAPGEDAVTRTAQPHEGAMGSAAPPGSARPITLDPETRPAMMVLGAAGLGAPLTSTPNPAPHPGSTAVLDVAPAPPPEGPPPPPVAMGGAPPYPPAQPGGSMDVRTLRSEQGYAVPAHPAPQGYVLATQAIPQQPHPPGAGPRTQISGATLPAPPAPGEKGPAVPAPATPLRRRTLPGTEIGVLPLILVGVLFASIGVGVTLWFMLRGSSDASVTPPATSATNSLTDRVMHPVNVVHPAHGAPPSPGLATSSPPKSHGH